VPLPVRIPPGPGQESVWDFPRPPRVERVPRRLLVRFAGRVVAETQRGLRVVETSQAPAYYFPPDDVDLSLLVPSEHRPTWCEWKGAAVYRDLVAGGRRSPAAAWLYPDPTAEYAAIGDLVAFYPQRVHECRVDGEVVTPNAGDFYGGWITADLVGPFKGGPGSSGW
jgi:uncharacterized protein (DUF427 family)